MIRTAKTLSTLAALALLLPSAACSRGGPLLGDDDDSPRTVVDLAALKDFTKVTATGPDDVVITVGKPFAVNVEAGPKLRELLEIKVKDGTLQIGRRNNWESLWSGSTDEGAVIHVALPSLAGVQLTGSGDIDVDRAEGDRLDLGLTGSGDLEVKAVKVARVDADVTGSGSITLAGTADQAGLSTTGSGDIEGAGLKVNAAKAQVLGSGGIAFASDGAVDGRILGSGDITVKGKAQCKSSVMGSGELRCSA